MVKALIKPSSFVTLIRAEGHQYLSDEPELQGGKDIGMEPKIMLLASLASCTAMTLRMYCDRKQWKFEEIEVQAWFIPSEDQQNSIGCSVLVSGDLNDEQKNRLLYISKACPVHKMLTNPLHINTFIEEI